jgi:excisionase family DNA binding protein
MSDSPREPSTLTRLPTFLTVDELAQLLRINRKSAYEAVAKGEIPGARRIGRTIRITRDAVVGWLRGQGHVSRSSGRNR